MHNNNADFILVSVAVIFLQFTLCFLLKGTAVLMTLTKVISGTFI